MTSDFREEQTNKIPKEIYKKLQWSPDGLCLLAAVESIGGRAAMHLREYSLDFWRYHFLSADIDTEQENEKYEKLIQEVSLGSSEQVDALRKPALTMHPAGSVSDMTWYPLMSSQDPQTCCFASCSRDQPIQLWDAFTGTVRCVYTPIDHREELASASSLQFNSAGDKLYAGLKNMICVFDVSSPGHQMQTLRTTPTRKSPEGFKGGIISSIAFSPNSSGLYAVGTFSNGIAFYAENSTDLVWQVGHPTGSGITHMQFTNDGHYLYVGARKDSQIICYDIRKTMEPLFTLPRSANTNQRLYFDIRKETNQLITGDTDGQVLIYDGHHPSEPMAQLKPSMTMRHYSPESVVTNTVWHPLMPCFASCSGTRIFPDFEAEQEQDESTTATGDFSLKISKILK